MRYTTSEGYDPTVASARNTAEHLGSTGEIWVPEPFTDHYDIFFNELTEAMSIRIETQIRDWYPHTIRYVGIKPNFSRKGGNKDNVQQSRSV